jgi:hypothetical protein
MHSSPLLRADPIRKEATADPMDDLWYRLVYFVGTEVRHVSSKRRRNLLWRPLADVTRRERRTVAAHDLTTEMASLVVPSLADGVLSERVLWIPMTDDGH